MEQSPQKLNSFSHMTRSVNSNFVHIRLDYIAVLTAGQFIQKVVDYGWTAAILAACRPQTTIRCAVLVYVTHAVYHWRLLHNHYIFSFSHLLK